MGYRNRGGGFLVGFGKYSIRLRSQEPCRGPDPDPLALFAVPGHTEGGAHRRTPLLKVTVTLTLGTHTHHEPTFQVDPAIPPQNVQSSINSNILEKTHRLTKLHTLDSECELDSALSRNSLKLLEGLANGQNSLYLGGQGSWNSPVVSGGSS